MRILMTAPPLADVLSPGGIYKVIREISKNLVKRGHEVIVLQLNPLNRPNEEEYDGFKIIRVDSKHFYGLSLGMYSYLKKHLAELDPDIVHVHGYHNLLAPEVIWVIKRNYPSVPLVFSPHLDVARSTLGGRYFWRGYNAIIGKKAFDLADRIISPSEFEVNILVHQFSISPDKILIIPHGVDIIDTEKPLKQRDKICLLYSGYLIKRKRVEYVLESLHSLVYDFGVDDVILTIIGEGPEKKRLLELARKLRIMNKIEWKPFLPRKEFINKIKNADVFLLLSESEAYGITVAEALALGTPVIVTKKAALREFLTEPGCFGVDYPPNPKEVARLILEIANNDVKVGPFSKKIRTWKEVVKDYENLYKDILGI
ncbi:glycosyltransferase family 4 protein [Palaeococcus ferrophilus]|uniref:glycosyltransferase family 4 protein n=1 Tax=Palaeococcus ferrophilus TaxID=83868 RepID=UPI00064FD812|nr:glycosyltransferase family 4 protein [Palaeococcus ferrophilus]